MRLTLLALGGFLLACSGLTPAPEAPPAPPVEVPPPPPAPVLYEVVVDPGAPHPARAFATVKAGSNQGLMIDGMLTLVGPAPAVGGPQPVIGSARVTEITADSARLVPVRLADPMPSSVAARALTVEDQGALAALPEVKPGGGGRRPGPGPAAVGGPGSAGPAGGPGLEIPAELRTGSANDREDAVARYEGRPDATAVIVWVMKNDPAESVRFKAWRVVRARWKKGIGDASDHEQAAAWLAGNGSKDARLEAIDELGARSRNVERAGAQIDDEDPDIRAAAVRAVYEVADRTGKRDKGREVLSARRSRESSAAVRSKIDAALGKL